MAPIIDLESTAGEQTGWRGLFATIKGTLIQPTHAAGWPFILIFALITVGLTFLSNELGLMGLAATLWCYYFFRDPRRVTPNRLGLVIAPACGTVTAILKDQTLPPELTGALDTGYNFTRISIFLSVFDVHVNRVPVGGTVISKAYRPGKFLNAALDKASTDNEMSATLLRMTHKAKDYDVGVVQIAGWVARRILNDLREGQTLQAGARMGIIRFGSRVDVYIPEQAVPLVCVGQKTIEGETVLADFDAAEEARTGEVR